MVFECLINTIFAAQQWKPCYYMYPVSMIAAILSYALIIVVLTWAFVFYCLKNALLLSEDIE